MLAIDDYRQPRVLVGCELLVLEVMVKEFKGTPGPWHWEGLVLGNDDFIVGGDSWRFKEADKNLIAAAPELLEALQLAKHVIINMLPTNSASRNKVAEMAEKAIAKALGE